MPRFDRCATNPVFLLPPVWVKTVFVWQPVPFRADLSETSHSFPLLVGPCVTTSSFTDTLSTSVRISAIGGGVLSRWALVAVFWQARELIDGGVGGDEAEDAGEGGEAAESTALAAAFQGLLILRRLQIGRIIG